MKTKKTFYPVVYKFSYHQFLQVDPSLVVNQAAVRGITDQVIKQTNKTKRTARTKRKFIDETDVVIRRVRAKTTDYFQSERAQWP